MSNNVSGPTLRDPEKKDILLGEEPIIPSTGLTDQPFHSNYFEEALYSDPIGTQYRQGQTSKPVQRILNDKYHPEFDPEYNAVLLAREQSPAGQFVNALNQAIVGEIAGGTIEGLGYLGELPKVGKYIMGTEQEFGNGLSRLGNKLKTWTQETAPIFVDPNQSNFAPGRWSWWMSNAPSIASTLSLAVPAMGVTKGIAALGKATKLFDEMGIVAKGMTQAVVSRHMENMMEANGVYQEAINSGKSKEAAALSAANTYNKQWALLLQDIPQYILFNKLALKGLESNKEISSLLGVSADKFYVNRATSIAKSMVGEGFEEAYQYVVNEQSRLLAQQEFDPAINHSFKEALNNSLENGEFYTSAVFGALGAGAMLASAPLLNKQKIQEQTQRVVEDLKETGKISKYTIENYNEAQKTGDEVDKKGALDNMIFNVAIRGIQNNTVEANKELIRKIAEEDNTVAAESLGEPDLVDGRFKQDPDFAKSVLTGIDEVVALHKRFSKEAAKHKNVKPELKAKFAELVTKAHHTKKTLEAQKEISDKILNSLDGELRNDEYLSLSEFGKAKFDKENLLHVYEGHEYIDDNNKPVKKPGQLQFFEKRVKEAIGDKEKADLTETLNAVKEEIIRLKGEIKEVDSHPEYTADIKKEDEARLSGLDPDRLHSYLTEFRRNQYIDKAIKQTDKDLVNYRSDLKLASEKEKKDANSPIKTPPSQKFQVDDIVKFEGKDGKPRKGRIESVHQATLDDEGNMIEASEDNAENVYVVRQLDSRGRGTRYVMPLTGIMINMDTKAVPTDDGTYVSNDLTTQDLLNAKISEYQISESSSYKFVGTPDPIDNLSYGTVTSGVYRILNSKVDSLLSDPATDLSQAYASFYLNLSDEQYIKDYKNNNKDFLTKHRASNISSQQRILLEKLLKKKKLTKDEIKTLLDPTNNGSTEATDFNSFVDKVNIAITLTIDGKTESGGMNMHSSDFKYVKVPYSIRRKGPGAVHNHLLQKFEEAREVRKQMLTSILEGKVPRSQGLSRERGKPYTTKAGVFNVQDILKKKPSDIKLAVARPSQLDRHRGTLYVGNGEVDDGEDFTTAGSVYAFTNETVNGERFALKLNKQKIDTELGDIIYDAFRLMIQASFDGRKREKESYDGLNYDAVFKKENNKGYNVKGLSVGQFLDLFVVHGKDQTDPRLKVKRGIEYSDSEFEVMANKTLYAELDVEKKTGYIYYGNNSSLGNIPNKIDVSSASEQEIQKFIRWLNTNKTKAVRETRRYLGLALNGDFFKDSAFSIETKHLKIEKKRENNSYNDFLLNNNFLKTNAVRDEETGRLFHSPVLHLGLDVAREGENITLKYAAKEGQSILFPTTDDFGENDIANTITPADDIETEQKKTTVKKQKQDAKEQQAATNTKVITKTGQKKASPRLVNPTYYIFPTTEGTFEEQKGLKEEGNRSLFRISGTGNTRALTILTGKADTLLVTDKDLALDPVADIETIPGNINNKITMVEPGEVKKEGDTWRITKKMKIQVVSTNLKANPKTAEPKKPTESKDKIIQEIKKSDTPDEVWKGLLDGELGGAYQSSPEDDKGPLTRRWTSDVSFEKQDYERELAWVRKFTNIPKGSVHLTKLAELTRHGKKNFAIFTRDSILIYQGAETGTLYHEAFHRVSQGYLSDKERKSIYKLARQVYKLSDDITDRQVEEVLAENFRKFVIAKEENKPTNLVGRIKTWFQRMYDFIRYFFINKRGKGLSVQSIDALFNQIYRGRFQFSKITKENYNRLAGDEFESKFISNREFNTIHSTKQADHIVNVLLSLLVDPKKVNGLKDASSLNWNNVIDYFQGTDERTGLLDKFNALLDNEKTTPELFDEISTLKAQFEEVLEDVLRIKEGGRSAFVTKVESKLRELGIKKVRNAETLETTGDINEDESIVGKRLKFNDKEPYEADRKDSTMASVKFLIKTLRKGKAVNQYTQIKEFVDYNEVWANLLRELSDKTTVSDMIEGIRYVATRVEDSAPYIQLANLLADENTDEQVRLQFLKTFNIHRHHFINYLFSRSRSDGIMFEIYDTAREQGERAGSKQWNEAFFSDPNIVTVEDDGTKYLNEQFFQEIRSDFIEIQQLVEDRNPNDKDELFKRITDILNRLKIDVDSATIQARFDNFTEGSDVSKMLALVNDISGIVGKESNLMKAAFENSDKENIADIDRFFRKIPAISSLSAAHLDAHPELIPSFILGPQNNRYFNYAPDNMVTDIEKRMKNRPNYISEHKEKIGNKHSLLFDQFSQEDANMEDFRIFTFSKMAEKNRGDRGRAFDKVIPLEDYLVKIASVENGYIPMPVFADRKSHYLMSGLDVPSNVLEEVSITENGFEFTWSDEFVDILYGYYLDEKERIQAATDLKKRYDNASAKEKKVIENTEMYENYHYTKNKKTGEVEAFSEDSNALRFIHFDGFNIKDSADKVKDRIKKTLDGLVIKEADYASEIDVLHKDGTFYKNRLISTKFLEKKEVDYGIDESDDVTNGAILKEIAELMGKSMIGIFESEKVFFTDPAFFKRGKNGGVFEEMYKRWAGPSATGENLATSTTLHPETTYNVLTVNTQHFRSEALAGILEKQIERYKKMDVKNPEELAKAAVEAAYGKVDPTDGQMFITPELYKSISDRLGLWDDAKDEAFKLLQSDKKLTVEEETRALGIVLNPLKLVHIGKEDDPLLDPVIYDKMSMATLFRRQVRDTHLEDVLDMMEEMGAHALKFDTVTKVGNRPGIDLFTDPQERTELNDITKGTLHKQRFDNLRHQLITDPHETESQDFGTQVFKVSMMNVNKEAEYGRYGTGQDILNKITNSRVAASNIGVMELTAKFGVRAGQIDDVKIIQLLSRDALSAGKSQDFQDALKIENGKMYLHFDSFPDKDWLFQRLTGIVNSHTVDISYPGNQLIQVTEYGLNSKGKQISEKNKVFERKELKFLRYEKGKVYSMEARVSVKELRHIIPGFKKKSYSEIKAIVENEPIEAIAYRIPTQGQNSVVVLNVVDVLPENAGDVIHLPLEFTALTGADFDIDKLFFHTHHYFTNKEGKIKKVPYIYGDEDPSLELRFKKKKGEIKRIFEKDQKLLGENMPSFETFKSWSEENQNTREANHNRMLDAFIEILGNDEHFLEVSTPLGRNTQKLKDLADLYNEWSGEDQAPDALSTTTSMFQSKTKSKFARATTGVGPFALGNAHHSLTQQIDLEMPASISIPGITYDREAEYSGDLKTGSYVKLNRVYSKDGSNTRISDWMSALIDAHVDAAKDPYIISLNVNEATYNVTNYLLRIGLGEKTFGFLSQPIIKEYAKEFFNANGRITAFPDEADGAHATAFNYIKQKWLNKIADDDTRKELDKQPIKMQESNYFSKARLEEGIKKENYNTAKHIEEQLAMLELFNKIKKDADDLNRVVMASRIDTKKFGNTPAELRFFLNNIMSLEEDFSDTWINLEKLINSNGEYQEGYTMLSPLINNSIKLIVKIMEGKSLNSSDGFSKILWRIIESSPNTSFMKKSTFKYITNELYAYMSSNFFTDTTNGMGLTPAKVRSLLKGKNSIYTTIQKIKRGEHELSSELKDPVTGELSNKFLNALIVDIDEESPLQTFFRLPLISFKNDHKVDDYVDDLRDLYTNPNPKIRQLFNDIFVTAFYTSGLNRHKYSIHNYMPLDAFKSLEIEDPVNKDETKNVSFDDYIRRLNNELQHGSGAIAYFEKAFKQVFENNWNNPDLVPRIDNEEAFEPYTANGGNIYGYKVTGAAKLGLYKGDNDKDNAIFAPYILFVSGPKDRKTSELLRYVGVTDRKPVYKVVRKKGISTARGVVLKEYGLDNVKSIIDPVNKEKAEQLQKDLVEAKRFDLIYNPTSTASDRSFFQLVQSKEKKTNKRAKLIVIPFVEQYATKRAIRVAPEEDSMNIDYRGGLNLNLEQGTESTNEKVIQKPKQNIEEAVNKVGNIDFTVIPSLSYAERTRVNARETKATLAFAYDFETTGEKVTARAAGDKLFQLDLNNEVTDEAIEDMVTFLNMKEADSVNIAGNGIGTLGDRKISQEIIDIKIYNILKKIVEHPNLKTPITLIQSGGQTGVDEAGSKAGNKLGIPGKIVTTADWKYRIGKWSRSDVSNNQRGFMERFGEVDKFTEVNVETDNAFTNTAMKPKPNKVPKRSRSDVGATFTNDFEKISTPQDPIYTYVDGSILNSQSDNPIPGVGSHIYHAGKEYVMSLNSKEVMKYFDRYKESEEDKLSTDFVELLALYTTLKEFEETSEHLHIYQDNQQVSNYGRIWDRAVQTDAKMPNRYKSSKPVIRNLLTDVEKLIDKIENNGGSFKIEYIPSTSPTSSQRAYAERLNEKRKKFPIKRSQIEAFYKGNKRADSLAADPKNRNTIRNINAQKVNKALVKPTAEEQDSTHKNNCNND